MKKRLRVFMIGFVLAVFMVGCTNQVVEQAENKLEISSQVSKENTYNENFEKYAEDKEMGLIINEPTQEVLENVTHLENYKHIEKGEKMLIVPKYNGSKVMIHRVEFEEDDFVVKETLYSKVQTEKDYGLLLETIRPEGIPELMITITTHERSINYLVAYNGKDGTSDIEYLKLEVDK